ncbi:inorganic diphosphatase [Sphingobacterium daejeonense]|uniref:inorganic diphosphatase n=1 Tax=Sphingobacterium daejeonense TaxID=371142 RepID=UPI0021A88AFC|nr:inorganic diphosphatase [Sphingobacterium daejeonense]MCT1530274.1 inorganic diphosphatase [Sphingobacterium daejeonense]
MNRSFFLSLALLFSSLIGLAQDKHPWHQVSPGKDTPETVTAVIEIPKGTRGKYEVDKTTGLIKLDRVIQTSMVYPANYGFIPQSYCGDKDPLDILVICSVDLEPLSLVDAKVIGVMSMTDSGDQDDKIIAVAKNDMEYNHINDISELPPHTMKEIVHFFQEYKGLEEKKVIINKISGRAIAQNVILESLELYKKEFANKNLNHGN